LVIAAIAAIAFGALTDLLDLSFIPGLNLTNADGEFARRYTDHKVFSAASLTTYGWASASVDAKRASPSARASADAMAGVGVLPTFLNGPFSILGYGTGSAAVDVKLSTFLGLIVTAVKPELDAGLQLGAVATAALSMQEYTPAGEAVGDKITLNTPITKPCDAQEVSGADGEVSGVTCTYSPSKTSATVTVTYVSAEKAGILRYGKTPVSPKSYEMILEVKNFPLTSSRNHVRMSIALFSAAGTAVLDGKSVIVPGGKDMYSAVSDYAVIDDDHAEVKVTINAGSAELQATAEAIIKGSVGRDFDAYIADVDFPAGAKSFIYDPVVGVGANVYKAAIFDRQGSSACTAALSLLVALVCAILCLF